MKHNSHLARGMFWGAGQKLFPKHLLSFFLKLTELWFLPGHSASIFPGLPYKLRVVMWPVFFPMKCKHEWRVALDFWLVPLKGKVYAFFLSPFHQAAWNINVMVRTPTAILDQESKGHAQEGETEIRQEFESYRPGAHHTSLHVNVYQPCILLFLSYFTFR